MQRCQMPDESLSDKPFFHTDPRQSCENVNMKNLHKIPGILQPRPDPASDRLIHILHDTRKEPKYRRVNDRNVLLNGNHYPLNIKHANL